MAASRFPFCSRLLVMLCLVSTASSACALDENARRASQPDFALASANEAAANPLQPTSVQPAAFPQTQPQTTSTPAHSPDNPSSSLDQVPLRFAFPTPGAEPVSIWRPPLYPVPWEPTPNDHFFFTRPIGANEVNWPLANYRYGGVFFSDTVHTGIDIPAPKGTPVMAAGSGVVTWAGFGLYFLRPENRDPYGLAVAIKHDFGYDGHDLYTVYGHMDELYAYQGQKVQAGDVIGLVGETGNVTGPHLHFEVRIEKNNYFGSRNPELWIAPPQGWGVVAARVMAADGDPLYRQSVRFRNTATNQTWTVLTYGKGSVNPDPYYRENVVIGDLPAGEYVIWIDYLGGVYHQTIEVLPGMVSYFTYQGKYGFAVEAPRQVTPTFTPPDLMLTPTP